MSIKNWPGGVISDVPPTPEGPYQDSAASGVWTLEQQAYWESQGLWPIPGNVNPDAFIENLFSTYLYDGTQGTQTINNGVDLAGKGGMVWFKSRNNSASTFHNLVDTSRGTSKFIFTNDTSANVTDTAAFSSFNSNGFTLGSGLRANAIGDNYASWTFRKQPKFFDVVTYSYQGNGPGTTAQIPHNLGSAPGMIMIKAVDKVESFIVWHRTAAGYFKMDSSQGADPLFTGTGAFGSLNPAMTDTYFTVGYDGGTNFPGYNYVAYIFAHDSGGFGVSGTENVITCGSYVGNGSTTGPVITLGYEPQWVMIKRATGGTGNWRIYDTMRGWITNGDGQVLYPNLSSAESTTLFGTPTATGFQLMASAADVNASGSTYIYIAIRRGPMKTPTDGTSVFAPATRTGNDTSSSSTAGFPVDLGLTANRGAVAWKFAAADRLRGATFLRTAGTNAEGNPNNEYTASSFASNTQLTLNGSGDIVNANANTYIDLMFQRAPGFFDVVCYTGTGSAQAVNHNLGVAPELIIEKRRDDVAAWLIYHDAIGNTKYLQFTTAAEGTSAAAWNNTSPTSTQFTVGTGASVSGGTHIAYLFASCPGVSKVGSYTGTGTTQTINCGFTAGSRFVLIKRTDSTGDWYVWDSARGIVAGNDPYLLLNSTAAEVTSTDYVDTATTGFEISSTAPAAINANGGTFIFLAIA